MFAASNHPSWPLWKLFMWFVIPTPITSYGSPYSLAPHRLFTDSATRCPAVLRQSSELAWWTPRLWPYSCEMTRSWIVPFTHDVVPGTYASPAQPQGAPGPITYW